MTASNPISIRRALISVSDKTGIVELAQALHARAIEILSTGGTAQKLLENNIPVVEVSDYTGFPEMMAGRVKTLHPKIHGGLLGRRGVDDAVMADNHIPAIDLLVVNLYPFEQTVANPSCTLTDAIENIDIGGPALLRAAAKNFAAVTVLVDANDYADVIKELDSTGSISAATRQRLATKVFAHTARYDAAIANYLGAINESTDASQPSFPSTYSVQFHKAQTMRYGENPHQQAAFYVDHNAEEKSVATARQLQGKALSYNNVADSDAALECVKSFAVEESSACVIVKHANPCGVALGESPLDAYQRAYQTDPNSAFGGIIAFNQTLDETTASAIIERQFVEVIIAPAVTDAAQKVLSAKQNVRVLETGSWAESGTLERANNKPIIDHSGLDYKRVTGGLLLQTRDTDTVAAITVKSHRQPSDRELADLLFAWKVAKFVKSNAIVYARDAMTIGIGAGQMSRVYSARIAAIKAADENLQVTGSVMASDAFFPFRDGIDTAAQAGITAVIQPGGSMRDDDVIQAANEHNMAMVFTGMRHFRH